MSYPIVLQRDSSSCGPACLAMISAYFGNPQPVDRLAKRARSGRQGTSLAGLMQAASEIGFEAHGIRVPPDTLPASLLPAIAHWSGNGRNHFVVLYAISNEGATVGDPAFGLRNLTIPEFRKRWTGILLTVTRKA